MKKKVRPRHSEKSNTNIRLLIKETGEKIKGVDNLIPPKPEPYPAANVWQPEIKGPIEDDSSIVKPTLYTDGFLDSAMALSFIGGFISMGIFIGMNLR